MITWKTLPLHGSSNGHLCPVQRLKGGSVTLHCVALAFFIAVSSARGQDPATVGQFSSVYIWGYIATHANMLPTGKVLWWPQFTNGDNPTLWDPSTNTNNAATHAGAN